ncbi:MAG: hypothetical protein ACR2NZ_00210 [Rubripirellula sp.]
MSMVRQLSRRPLVRSGSLSKLTLWMILVLAAVNAPNAIAAPITWMERYALAEDREQMLAELIPGSDDYYFYHCLYYQTTGQLERSETILREWLADHEGRETPTISAMTDRQRLLAYGNSPQRTIDYLVRRLGIKLNHTPPVTKNARRFPSQLDVAKLDVDRLVKEALQRNDTLKPQAMRFVAEQFRQGKIAGFKINLKEFLQRVDGAYLDDLDDLVIQELSSRKANERRFGDLRAHQFLTLSELQQLAERVPDVADDDKFVAAMLQRLRPSDDLDASRQRDVRVAYLKRVEDYVQTLPPSYASMQASAAYRLMEANLEQGVFDRDLFERYLQLPRVSPIVHEDWQRRVNVRADLNQNFMSLALLPPVGNEEPLVRAHLAHFLRDAKDVSSFDKYLKPDYLRRVFAETKLMQGIGREEQWYRMLNASQRQAIRDKVELRISVDNPKHFKADQPTQLNVDLKNIPELVIRIYEINTSSYYRNHEKLINTDIDLDGLVATHERKIEFNQPAVRRHAETLNLKEIEGRGVWIADLVGQGVRARALIRRGEIDHVDSFNADGMVFTIIDENRKPIPAATMWVGAREFIADDQGRIVLPPVVDQVSRRAIISDGEISNQVKFPHMKESYHLSAGMNLDRSLIQSGGETKLMIRPRLMMGSNLIDPGVLTEVSVQIASKDLDDLTTNYDVKDIKLSQNKELVIPIRVPSRLTNLKVTLSGRVERLADGQEQTLRTSRSWDIAGIRRTSLTHDSFLTRDGQDFVIEVRGRNGEPVERASVLVSLTTALRNAPVEETLQSDELGRVRLGSLEGVTSIRYSVPSGIQHERRIDLDQVRWADEIHTTTDRVVQLPLAIPDDEITTRYRLMEVRGGGFYADRSDRLTADRGLLTIAKLAAGDYRLLDQATAEQTMIAVVSGPVLDSVAVGETRHRSITRQVPLGIVSIRRGQGEWKIQLSGQTQTARVHLYASRYLDGSSPLTQLDLPLPRLTGRRVHLPSSGYVSDLRLGDEYQYVLRRRYAKKYPGVMLPQPGILLNPWETEETSNTSQAVADGERPPPMSEAAPFAAMEDVMAKLQAEAEAVNSDYDFLADPGLLLSNLQPDAQGVVTVADELVQGLPILQVVACDPGTIVQRTVTAPLDAAETVDLRLADTLNTAIPFTFERGVTIASPNDPLDLKSLGSAQLQVYGTVGELMKLYKTLVSDPRLNDFDILADWSSLDEDAKMEAYSRLASHELHLFLRFHDGSFFEQVVVPYLQNKKEKQFIDHWLLDDDLTQYTALWRYNELNAAERTLLSMRVPEMRTTVQRQLQEVVAQQDENYAAVRRGFESALKQRVMDAKTRSLGRQSLMLGDEAQTWESLSRRRMERLGKAEARYDHLYADDQAVVAGSVMFGGRVSGGIGGGGMGGGAFFRNLDSTKQWAERQWDQVRTVGGPSPSSLVGVNPFWVDIAAMEPGRTVVSKHLLRPTDNRHSALIALALSGLPLTAGKIDLPTEADQAYRPEHAVAVVTKRLKRLDPTETPHNLLIGQRFETVEKQSAEGDVEPSEFLTGVAYKGQIVVSNPNASERTVDLFWQLPAGSLPLAGNRSTDSRTVTLKGFAVQAIEYQFYFPAVGDFAHYAATVAIDGKLIARGEPKQFEVVAEPAESTVVTWEQVAVSGSPEEIKSFLAKANLRQIEWSRIAHRMKDPNVFRVVVDVLANAKISVPELWAYGFMHRDEAAMSGYLSMRSDLCGRVGPVFQSTLLVVDPIERRSLEFLEYAPLVRARIHRLGEDNEILNPTFHGQYERFARVLGYASQIGPEDRLALTYYLLIQNRISEAIESFAKVDRSQVDTKLQYDYLSAYLSMHQGNYAAAEKLAKQHANHAVPRWRERFTMMRSQLRQRQRLNETEKLVSVEQDSSRERLEEGSGDLSVIDRERRQELASDQQPEVIVRVEGDSLRIDHRRAKEVSINFYGVDLELLFSKAPFVREDLQRMAMVRPTRSDSLKFDESTGIARMELDGNLRRQTLLIEAVAGAARSTALYYGGDITTYVSESYGQLQTTDMRSGRPIATAYVKVYAKYPDGRVKFYKDGYTDARGRFDYVSLSAADAQGASRYAILVMSDELGATVHDVAAPNQ